MTDQEIQLRAAPSKEAVVRYLLNEPNSTQAVIKSLLERTVLIGAGMMLFGKKGSLLRNSFGASLAIELYLLVYYQAQLKKR